MSYELAKAYIQIVPTTNNFGSTLTSAISSPAKTAGTTAGTTLGNNMNSAASKIMKAISFTAVVAAAEKAFSSIAEAGSEYETALAQVETIMDETQMSTEEMSEAILQLSTDTGVAASDLSSTVYSAISATGDTANAVELAAQATQLATAGFTDTDSALSALTTAMNAYGLSADEAEAISDSLIQTQNLGVTTVDELASSMGKAISTASAYGVDLSNLESAYVSLTKAGISTEESTTYLSSMLSELGDSGSDVSTILAEQTGKSFTELMEDGYSLGDVLGILYDACGEDETALMNLWSSQEAGKASNAIVSQGLEEFNENLETIANSSGTTAEAYETMAGTLEYQSGLLQNTGTNLMIALYDGMEGQLATVVGFANTILGSIYEAYTTDGISGLAELGSETLQWIADGIEQGLPTVVAAAPEIISGVLDYITENLPQFLNQGVEIINSIVNGILNSIPVMVGQLPQIISSLTSFVAENLPTIAAAGADILSNLISGIIGMIPDLVASIPEIITSIVNGLGELLPSIVEAGGEIVAGIIEGLIGGVASIGEAVLELGDAILSGIKSFFGISSPSTVMEEQGGYVVSGFINGIASLPGEFASYLTDTISNVTSFAASLASGMMTAASTALSNIVSGIKNMPAKVKEKLDSVTSKVATWKESIVADFKSIGKNVISGLISGITSMVSSLYSSIKNALSGLVDKAKSALGISSPSKVFMEIGDYMAQGLDAGFTDGMENVNDSVEASISEMAATAGAVSAAAAAVLPETMAINTALVDQADKAKLETGERSEEDESIKTLTELLKRYLPAILSASEKNIVLDTGTLVGATATAMDKELGKISRREMRMA